MPFLPQEQKTPLGIYIHIPFCRSKCVYCDFHSLTGQSQQTMDQYLKALCAHIREQGPLTPSYQVDSVFFGGGTPSLFGADRLAAVLTAIRESFHVSPGAEITVEANPDSIDKKLLKRLKSEGFNRLSIGVQTTDDALLKTIGRPHTYKQAEEAVRLARWYGFKSISVDLMFGLPGQSMEGWIETLRRVLTLSPEHISCYGLRVEEKTPLYELQQHYEMPDDDIQADMYLAAVDLLKSKGYRQYEISNFAKRKHECKHNIKYWTGGEYLGFGVDASSSFAGKRFKIVKNLKTYMDAIEHRGVVMVENQEVPARDRAGEYLMLQLRTSYGIEKQEYERQFLLPFAPLERVMKGYENQQLAMKSDGRWLLTPKGYLLSNTIITDLLLAQEQTIASLGRR